jgi:hypothetical protein
VAKEAINPLPTYANHPALSEMAGLCVGLLTNLKYLKVQKNKESIHKICECQKKVVPLRRICI